MSEVLRKVFAYDGMNVSFARKGETVMVSLMSAYERDGFYKKFGFVSSFLDCVPSL